MRLRIEDVQGRNCLTNFWVSDSGSLGYNRRTGG
jgi:ribosomal protein S3AE